MYGDIAKLASQTLWESLIWDVQKSSSSHNARLLFSLWPGVFCIVGMHVFVKEDPGILRYR